MPLDRALFDRQITNESHMLALVLKGHLWIEACLNRALDVALHEPSQYSLDRESFARKLSLCAALHAVSAEAVAPISAINKLRNRIAHELEREVVSADVNALDHAFQGHLRVMYDEIRTNAKLDPEIDMDSDLERMKLLVAFLVMFVEHQTMLHEYAKTFRLQIDTHGLLKQLEARLGAGALDQTVLAKNEPPPPPKPEEVWTNVAS